VQKPAQSFSDATKVTLGLDGLTSNADGADRAWAFLWLT